MTTAAKSTLNHEAIIEQLDDFIGRVKQLLAEGFGNCDGEDDRALFRALDGLEDVIVGLEAKDD